jgi:hypothetical protein
MLDNYTIAINTKGPVIKLIELNKSLEDIAREEEKAFHGNVLLEVNNPLKQNIITVLKNKPVISLKKAYECQLFLERLHGYLYQDFIPSTN